MKGSVRFLMKIIQAFKFKTIFDQHGNEFIVFSNSALNSVDNIEDKTLFEASENHIHLLNNIKKRDYKNIDIIGKEIGNLLLDRLRFCFPEKKFYVFVSYELHGSLIVRFHQEWSGEEPFYDSSNPSDRGKRFSFYG